MGIEMSLEGICGKSISSFIITYDFDGAIVGCIFSPIIEQQGL